MTTSCLRFGWQQQLLLELVTEHPPLQDREAAVLEILQKYMNKLAERTTHHLGCGARGELWAGCSR
jgi:hypothetical protein